MDVFGRIGARDQYEKWRQVYEAHPGAANFFEVRPK
jgi:hypothetical protein